jgi:AcrR family transcriptional regulator
MEHVELTVREGGGRELWIKAGLDQLASGGIESVKVEVLAKSLGVTKGGFYWHFKDRRALLVAIVEDWRDGRVAAIERQTQSAGRTARERLLGLARLYSEAVNPRGMAIELAIRQWARRDALPAAAVQSVDAARLRSIAGLYEDLGQDRQRAKRRALLFYAFVFGQSLLFLEGSSQVRREQTASCARLLADLAD